MLRDAKHRLEPSLIEQGFHFHGLAIRESRRQDVSPLHRIDFHCSSLFFTEEKYDGH